MPKTPLRPGDILTLLRDNPGRIASLTAGLTPSQLRAAPEPGAWSLTETLAHLRACADVWGDCIATMLAKDAPTIRAINPTTWIEQTDYRDLEFAPSFGAFTAQRADLLTALETLSPERWERDATITGAGAPLSRTVRFYAQWLARHERSHVGEVVRVAKTVRG